MMSSKTHLVLVLVEHLARLDVHRVTLVERPHVDAAVGLQLLADAAEDGLHELRGVDRLVRRLAVEKVHMTMESSRTAETVPTLERRQLVRHEPGVGEPAGRAAAELRDHLALLVHRRHPLLRLALVHPHPEDTRASHQVQHAIDVPGPRAMRRLVNEVVAVVVLVLVHLAAHVHVRDRLAHELVVGLRVDRAELEERRPRRTPRRADEEERLHVLLRLHRLRSPLRDVHVPALAHVEGKPRSQTELVKRSLQNTSLTTSFTARMSMPLTSKLA